MKETIFKPYDIRGIYPDELDEEAARAISLAFGKYLKADLSPYGGSPEGRENKPPFSVAIGQDMRTHSPFLAREVIGALRDQGIDVLDLGRVPTPALYFATAFKDLAGGIMITASHNPKNYNGLKFCGRKAVPIAADSGLERIRSYVLEGTQPERGARGNVTEYDSAVKDYVSQELSYLNPAKIKRLKIAADPANAMGALYLDEFFSRVDCDPIKINWALNGNMPAHEANPLKPETLKQLQEVTRNEKADFGIATDGDGDRIAFLDERGEVMPAGVILGLVAERLLQKYPGAKIGYDLRMSRAVKEMIESAGGVAAMTRVGHSYIKKQMREEDILFAGELSMHYYFRENYFFESPVFVAAQLLLIRSEAGKPFSEIWKPRVKYHHSGEINYETPDKQAVIKRLEEKYQDGQISRLDGASVDYDDWWFNVRVSNTEPLLRLNLEADTEERMKQKLEEVKGVITNP